MIDAKSNVMEAMFGVFNKPAESVKWKKEEEAGNALMYRPDPKNATGQIYRGVIKFLPNLADLEGPSTVGKVTYWVPEGADLKSGFSYDSPKSLGKYEKCIVADKYWELKESSDARVAALAKKLNYNNKTYALIQVVSDPQKPENNGKIMLWELPVAIQKKIDSQMYPSKEDIDAGEVANNVFDPMNGWPMVIKIGIKTVLNEKTKKTDEYRDYDECKFSEKLKSTIILKGEDKQLVLSDVPETLIEQQKQMLETILAGPSLANYAYKAPTEEVLNRVNKAFANMMNVATGQPIVEDAPETASDVTTTDEPKAETKAEEKAEEPKAEEKSEEPKAEPKAEETTKPGQSAEDLAMLKELGLDQ